MSGALVVGSPGGVVSYKIVARLANNLPLLDRRP